MISRLQAFWRKWVSIFKTQHERRKVLEHANTLGRLASYKDNAAIVYQTDFEGNLLHGNTKALDALNCVQSDLLSMNLYDLVREDSHGILDALFSLREFTQPKVFGDIYLKDHDDPYLIRYYRHEALGTTMFMFVEEALDNTMVQAQEERKWAERLQVMLFGLNHELKTPLATARGYIDLITMTGELEEHLEGAHDALSKMSQILNDMTAPMKELSQDAGARIDLGHAIDSYTKSMRFVEPTKRFVGRYEILNEAAQGKYVNLSQPRLYQILTNLFDNSIRATKHKEEGACITIHTHECDKIHHANCIVLSFADNGCGMDDMTLRQVFAPYFTTRGPEAGSGLGSYFVYQFIREAGGSIEVESALNIGTTMHLHLPYRTNPDSKEEP